MGLQTTPILAYRRGGGGGHNTHNLYLVVYEIQNEVDQYSVNSKNVVEEGPDTADEFPTLSNQVNVNKEGTTNDMAWTALVQD